MRIDEAKIRKIAKTNPEIIHWLECPLIHLDKDTEIDKKSKEYIENLFDKEGYLKDADEEKISSELAETVMEGLHHAPLHEFCYSSEHNYDAPTTNSSEMVFKVKIEETDESFFISTQVAAIKGTTTVNFITKMNPEENDTILVKDGIVIDESKAEEYMESVLDSINRMCIYIGINFYFLSISDLHAVIKKQPRYKLVMKRGKNKKKVVGSKDTIVFLNKLPTEHNESEYKGGHHASPKFHVRKGHHRIMRAERFKNHPDYMKKKWIKPMFIGAKSVTLKNGTTYKVL